MSGYANMPSTINASLVNYKCSYSVRKPSKSIAFPHFHVNVSWHIQCHIFAKRIDCAAKCRKVHSLSSSCVNKLKTCSLYRDLIFKSLQVVGVCYVILIAFSTFSPTSSIAYSKTPRFSLIVNPSSIP